MVTRAGSGKGCGGIRRCLVMGPWWAKKMLTFAGHKFIVHALYAVFCLLKGAFIYVACIRVTSSMTM